MIPTPNNDPEFSKALKWAASFYNVIAVVCHEIGSSKVEAETFPGFIMGRMEGIEIPNDLPSDPDHPIVSVILSQIQFALGCTQRIYARTVAPLVGQLLDLPLLDEIYAETGCDHPFIRQFDAVCRILERDAAVLDGARLQ
jgi:hypothetical protein